MNEYADVCNRIEEIREEVRKGNVSDELNSELDALLARKKEIEEKRAKMEEKFNQATPAMNINGKESRVEDLSKMSTRQKLAYVIGKQARGKDFNAAEVRALGSALTTTATTFIEATESVNGINNAGILISTKMIFDLLKEEGKLSPILSRINFMHIPGLTDIPYRETRDKAKKKAEGAAGKDNQMKWAKLQLSKGYLQTIIGVTDEVLALTDFDFGAYIIDQLLIDLNDDWAEKLVYGTGSDDEIKGITIGATAAAAGGYEEGKEVEAIVAGIKLLKGKYRRGAEIFVAQDIYDTVMFSTDDNGNFRYPIFNNSTGISSMGVLRVEVDETLSDGDFIIGNVSKYFKANILIDLRVEAERQARKAVTEFIASCYSGTAPFPGAFVHGKKA